MCGITGYYIRDPESPDLKQVPMEKWERLTDALLLGIERRGPDATGLLSVAVGSDKPHLEKADLTASKFISWRDPLVENPRFVLGHTRWATKGSPMNLKNNHPVQHEYTYAIHNGHIANDDALFAEHEFARYGEVDTEIIPALFGKFGIDKAHLALQVLDGSFAVGVCNPTTHPDTLLLAKGPMSPFFYVEFADLFIWASTKDTIKDAWKATFDEEIEDKSFRELYSGNIRILNGKSLEHLTFKPYQKPYVHVPFSQPTLPIVTTSRGGAEESSWEWRQWERAKWNRVCTCGETQYWHIGQDHEGSCCKQSAECEGFTPEARDGKGFVQETIPVLTSGGDVVKMVKCLECSSFVKESECHPLYGYYVCPDCNAETSETPSEEETIMEDIPTRHRFTGLDEMYYTSPDIVSKYDQAIIDTARAMDTSPDYVEFLLFDATDEFFENKPDLLSDYCLADDLHSDFLRHEVTNIADAPSLRKTEVSGVKVFDYEVDDA